MKYNELWLCHECVEEFRPSDMATIPMHFHKRGKICRACDNEERREAFRKRNYPAGVKVCGSCKLFKPFDCFHEATRHRDGLEGTCKDCKDSRRKPSEFQTKTKHELETREQMCAGECGEVLPFTSFAVRKDSATGRYRVCRSCRNTADRERRELRKRAEKMQLQGVVECPHCMEDVPVTDLRPWVSDYDGKTEHLCGECYEENTNFI